MHIHETMHNEIHKSCVSKVYKTGSLLTICNVPDPSIVKEDATITLSIWETSPMNIHIKLKFFELKHAYIITMQWKQTYTFKNQQVHHDA